MQLIISQFSPSIILKVEEHEII